MSMQKKEGKERPLLASRFINSLPVVRSVWGYGVDTYNQARDTSLFKPSIDAAEALVQPLVQRYKSIDDFASNAYDAVSSVGVVQAAAYPVGYAYGLALGTMNLMENNVQGTRLEKPMGMLYDVAGAIVDGVMPAPKDEKESADRSLKSKNPVRKIGKRANMQSIRGIPGNSIRFALQVTKKYTRMAAFKSLDYGVVFSARMAERCVNFFVQYNLIRYVVERPLPLLYELSENFAWSKRVRHDGGAAIFFAIEALLSQLDSLHNGYNTALPHTSELVEKISIHLYNIQQYLDHAKKRRLSVHQDEERLQKRSKTTSSSNAFPFIEQAQALVTPVVEKIEEFVAPMTEKASAPTPSETQTPIVNVRDAKTTAINPFAALLQNPDMTDEIAHVAPIHPNHSHPHHTHHQTAASEKKEETHDYGFDARIAERAKHELDLWKQREVQLKEERERHLRERHARERAEHEEQERKAKEDEKQERQAKFNKMMKERAEEKVKAEQAAKEAQEKKENEIFEKEIAHMKAHQQYEAEKAARDAKLAEKHREEEYAKKKAEVERFVKHAMAEREREWREEHADEIKAKEVGDELIEQERREKEETEKKREQEAAAAAKKEAAKEKARKAAEEQKEKEEEETTEAVAEKTEETTKPEQEIVLVGGHKVNDEVTHWSVETADDEPWQTVSHKKATHMSAEPILHPAPLKDAEGETPDKSNEFLALKNAQGEVSDM